MTEATNDWLILVPTPFELEHLRRFSEFQAIQSRPVECCGFGPIVSAARTAELIQRFPGHAIALIGIAGSYAPELELGHAYEFDSVACHGVGVGSGTEFQPAGQVGWKQWQSGSDEASIADVIQLSRFPDDVKSFGPLLTCTAASSSPDDVRARRALFPEAVAEDMEGFAVAAACKLAEVPLTIVRGISNVAGDRDKSRWQIEPSLQSALRQLVARISGC